MKLRNIFSIIILNVFLLGLVSLYQEYTGLRSTLQQLNTTIDLSVDRAISNTMSSEEMFSDEFDINIASVAHPYKDVDGYLYSQIKVMRGGSWLTGNMYIMSMFYQDKGRFPNSQTEYNSYASWKHTETIYEWLFGNIASDYSNSNLSWAFSSQTTPYAYNAAARKPTANFLAFYNGVGKYITSNKALESKVGSSWTLKWTENPALLQMGLKLDSLNEVTSTTTSKDFVSVNKQGYAGSTYYLTPYSLGVTYIPVEVLKPVVLSNIEQYIRFNKSKSFTTSLTDSASISMQDYASADGCIPLTIYDVGSNTPKEHKYSADANSYVTNGNIEASDMLNDGRVEYDMSTLKVAVDYFLVDFYDDANWKMVNFIEGAVPYNDNLTTVPALLEIYDTSNGAAATNSGLRVVAKVTVKIKIHIPYQSALLQWFVDTTSTDANEHYDIKMWSVYDAAPDDSSDGVWYEYTTYAAISR